nr:thiol:disulfide interchange protein [Pseudomonadota bacterium]
MAEQGLAMRALGYLLMTLTALLLAPAASAQMPGGLGATHHLTIALVAETGQPAAGGTVTLALDTRPEPGWHGYWQNPGDAGFPAKLDWTLPKGVTASAPAYPMPGTLLVAGLMNYVYEAPYAPLVTVTLPAGLAPGTALPIRLKASYLVCSASVCVPESADLAADLVVGNGAIDPAMRARFDAWRRAIPRLIGSPATYQRAGGTLRIGVAYPATAPLADGYFFASTGGIIDYAAPQSVVRDGDRVVIETKVSSASGGSAGGVTGPIAGILRVGPGQGLAVTATPGIVAPAQGSTSGESGVALAALIAFGGALLGGLM